MPVKLPVSMVLGIALAASASADVGWYKVVDYGPVIDGHTVRSLDLNTEGKMVLCTSSLAGSYVYYYRGPQQVTQAAHFASKPFLFARRIGENGEVLGAGVSIAAFEYLPSTGLRTLSQFSGVSSPRLNRSNRNGEVVGSCTRNGTKQGFVLSGGQLSFVEEAAGMPNVNLLDLNDAGQAVGVAWLDTEDVPFLWTREDGPRTLDEVTGDSWDNVLRLNAAGQVLGVLTSGQWAIWTGDAGTEPLAEGVPNAPVRAVAFNDDARWVGYADSTQEAYRGVVLGKPGEQTYYLSNRRDATTLAWTIEYVWAIDNLGRVAAIADHPTLGRRVVRLDPGLRKTGDANHDGDVDLDDYFELAEAFRSKFGMAVWNPRCDFDQNLTVDLDDYFLLADSYRQ